MAQPRIDPDQKAVSDSSHLGDTAPTQVDQWNLVELAAEGSLSRIYRATPCDAPADLPAAYALKMLRPDRQDDARAIRMLHREALAGRSVSHPHLIPVLAAGLKREPNYLVMPWIAGVSLQRQLQAGSRMDLPVALWVVRQVAEALDALYRAGWMHADVKPANVLLSAEWHVTLLDLGFARPVDEGGSRWNQTVAGTFSHMAPEWITTSRRPDIRSDIYSLGIVLYEMLTGRLPFLCTRPAVLAMEHRQALPPRVDRLAPHVPGRLASLVHEMLAKDPLRRPQTPEELIDRLTRLEIATLAQRTVHSTRESTAVADRPVACNVL